LLVKYAFTKRLHGLLEGIEVSDSITVDSRLGQPFTAGQRVSGIGSDYTIVTISKEG
jgi:hypothetical protein